MESREGMRAGRCGGFLGLNKAFWEPEDLRKAELLINAKQGMRERVDCDILGSKPTACRASGKMEEIVEAVKEVHEMAILGRQTMLRKAPETRTGPGHCQ